MSAARILCVILLAGFGRVDTISRSPDSGPCFYEQRRNGRLVKLQGVKIGYSRYVNLDGDEKKYRVTTKSLKPTIFEIVNFLSDSECEHFKVLARKSGLKESVAGFDERAYQGKIEEALRKADNENYVIHLPEFVDHFEEWDKNNDLVITIDEIKDMCQRSNALFFHEEEIHEMFRMINYTHFEDEQLTEEEFDLLPMNKLDAFLKFTQRTNPFHRPRYSEHTWLTEQKGKDSVLKKVHERIIRMTQLPRRIVEESEYFQVVRYGVFGHYHAHYDSSRSGSGKNLLCCHQNHDRNKECKLCRILTILFYLNDVKKGGETAFPVANNKTLDVQVLKDSKSLDGVFNLSKRCHSSNLIVPAKKGTAIMWYNHDLDLKTGWLGDLDYYTIHGGCDVLEGEKWIVNAWINAPTAESTHISSIFN